MTVKYFTLQEANGLLPIVDKELRTLQALKRQFEEKYFELRKLKEIQNQKSDALEGDPFFTMEAELEFIQIEARSHIQGFYRKGVELKDIEIGLVDFPAILEGEEVLLCWRQGEAEIGYYHSRRDGFSGRKPISDQQG